MKDCVDCPSFMDDDTAIADRFGRRSGTAMCARFGYVLTSPKLGQEATGKIRQHRALTCGAYGEPLTATPVSISPKVAHPDQSIIDAGDTGQSIRSCQGCKNMVKQPDMHSEHGFPVGLCRAYGKLVFKPTEECKGCTFASAGTPSNNAAGVDLLPEFRPGFTVDSAAVVQNIMEMGGGGAHDPRNYPTDREVSAEDDAAGIAAWRKVEDPEGEGVPVFLPIYKPETFAPEEALYIPQFGSKEHPEGYVDYGGLLYQFAVDSYSLNETLCLVGEPGLGKTEFGRWVAFLQQVPFHRFNFNRSSETDDMIGKMKFSPEKGTHWVDGRITKAYKTHCIIMLDELNLSPEECREVLRSMMDNSSQLVLDQDEGVVVNRHPQTRMLVSINPAWDSRNLGADEFADAEANRMSFSYVEPPPEPVRRHIIVERCKQDGYDIPTSILDKVIAIGDDLKEAATQRTFPGSWGTRQDIKFARKTQFYGVQRALKQAALNYYDPAIVADLLALVATH